MHGLEYTLSGVGGRGSGDENLSYFLRSVQEAFLKEAGFLGLTFSSYEGDYNTLATPPTLMSVDNKKSQAKSMAKIFQVRKYTS